MTTTIADEGSVRVAGTDIAYYRVGEGRPLVVVHGGPGMGHGYMRQLDRLADGRQLVYYDQRGSGNSPPGTRTASPSRAPSRISMGYARRSESSSST